VDDLADAVLFCIKNKISQNYINVGGNDYLNIKNLSKIIKSIIKYEGKLFYNKKYPDGVKERKLDTSIINKLGWKPKIKLTEGLKDYYFIFKNLA